MWSLTFVDIVKMTDLIVVWEPLMLWKGCYTSNLKRLGIKDLLFCDFFVFECAWNTLIYSKHQSSVYVNEFDSKHLTVSTKTLKEYLLLKSTLNIMLPFFLLLLTFLFLFLEMGFCCVVQAGLELLDSSEFPTSAFWVNGITGLCHHSWLKIMFEFFFFPFSLHLWY